MFLGKPRHRIFAAGNLTFPRYPVFYGQMAKNDSPDEDRVGGRSQTNVVKSRILRAIRVTFEFIRIAGEEEFSLE